MHTYTLTVAHQMPEYKIALPTQHEQFTVRLGARGVFAAFSSVSGNIGRGIVETLEIASKPLSRKQLADMLGMPKSTIRDKVKSLLARGIVQRVALVNNGRKTYYYTLAPKQTNPVRRSPRYWWKRCPVCNADRRLKRMASGNYEHWCGCGHFAVISQEIVK